MARSTASPTVLRWYIALELGALRQRSGRTQKQVAERLECSPAHVGHFETGHSLPSRSELEVLLDFYQVGERIPSFGELLGSARTGKDWWEPFKGAVPEWFNLFLGLESSAAQIESYDAQVIPGLFQTPAYTEVVMRAGRPEPAESEISRWIELRQARQEVLARKSDPPTVWSVLDEPTLYGLAGKPKAMREQLQQLTKFSELPNVTILVLPMDARPHAGSEGNGTFKILSFPHLDGAPAVAYTDGMVQGSYYTDPPAVLRYRNALTQLHNLAHDPDKSRARIQRRIEELT